MVKNTWRVGGGMTHPKIVRQDDLVSFEMEGVEREVCFILENRLNGFHFGMAYKPFSQSSK